MKYLSREAYLAEGARLLKNVAAFDTASARAAYAEWERKAQPSKNELLAVQRLARRAPARVLAY